MKDQYNNNVPGDLVLLEWRFIAELPETEQEKALKKIENLKWYKSVRDANFGGNAIFVSARQLAKIFPNRDDFTYFYDVVDKAKEWLKVDRCLYRWSPEDGFYHA